MEAHLGCRLGRFGRWREPVAQLLLPGDAIVARKAFAGLQALHFDVTQRGSGEDVANSRTLPRYFSLLSSHSLGRRTNPSTAMDGPRGGTRSESSFSRCRSSPRIPSGSR